MMKQVIAKCNLVVEKMFDFDDLKLIKKISFPEYRIRVILDQNGYG